MSTDILVAADRGTDGADGDAPRCFVVDQEEAARRLIASTLTDVGVVVEQFRDTRAMLAAFTVARAQVIFVDLGTSGNAAIETIQTFADMGVDCTIQMMSGLNGVLVEGIRKAGQELGLNMLTS